jgi:hypothetical protein
MLVDKAGARARRLRALEREIARLDRCLAALKQRADALSRWRLLTFALLLAGSSAALLIWGPIAFAVTGLVFAALFLVTVNRHRKLEQTTTRFRIWRDLSAAQVARMMLDWAQIPPESAHDVPTDHPFARDLDLVGPRSVHRLLDLSTTIEGSGLLREWLLEKEPDLPRMLQRQELVRELAQLPFLTNRLILNGTLAAGGSVADQRPGFTRWSGERLLSWLDEDVDKGHLRAVLIVLLALVPINLALLLGYLRLDWPPYFLASWLVYGVAAISQTPLVSKAFQDAAAMNDSLRRLEAVFAVFEQRSFAHLPALAAFLAPLRAENGRPADLLRRAGRLLGGASLRYNPLVALLLNAFVPWDVFFANRLLEMKDELRGVLPAWLRLWFEFEALSGLANVRHVHPEASFPVLIAQEQATTAFEGRQLGHPLIPAEQRVGNDFFVDHLGTLTIITGSNMAGKSSFLRTLGVNLRLGLCGAPVLAAAMSTIPFRVFASITVTDSVTDGFSFFYAEVRRLKALLEALEQPQPAPVFFLIDEIFRGTNNRERLIGSRAYVQALAGSRGTGAIATHDLELVHLADDDPDIRNFHFRDDVQDGRMVFDYKLHPGPCPTTNALRIMALAGLPVDGEAG